jgi:N-acylneuraminate cytidylyltransferase
MNWPEHYASRSQDLPTAWHDAGQFYWIKPEACLRENRLFTSNSGWIEIPASRAQDIDSDEDWELATMKFKYFQSSPRS